MKAKRYRFLCAFCALILLVSAVLPTSAWAAQGNLNTETSLTSDEAGQMQLADEAVVTLTDSGVYAAMSFDERTAAALDELNKLAAEGLVVADSIHLDEENGMISYSYPCGVLGGILVFDLDEENAQTVEFLTGSDGINAGVPTVDRGRAVIYYAFDNTVNSSRYPYYTYMRDFWTEMGMQTKLNTSVTLSDLRKMGQYDLCILSAHGSNYTYTVGKLFPRTYTEPIFLLMEKSTFWKDLANGGDLLGHRIIKVNGQYAITSDFFRSTVLSTSLENTIIFSETCEFLGTDADPSDAMAQALLSRGAKAVIGYRNNVYTVYSRSLLWNMVNSLALGETVGRALAHAQDTYGTDDLVWYNAQGGRRPHADASYALLFGDGNACLPITEVQQAA